jgi:SAM-dependent methyltransferase
VAQVTIDDYAAEIDENARQWELRPLLREVYRGFHERIASFIDHAVPGRVIEIGAGIGNLDVDAVATDIIVKPWLDAACSTYRLPFRDGAARAIILFDVFHHLSRPIAALRECARVLAIGGRVIVFEPFISATTMPVYGLLHDEPVAWRAPIDLSPDPPPHDDYYAAQGNATRMFFRGQVWDRLQPVHAEAFSAWHYLLSGGFTKPQMYPRRALPLLRWIDARLSAAPRLFGGRCLVVLEKKP